MITDVEKVERVMQWYSKLPEDKKVAAFETLVDFSIQCEWLDMRSSQEASELADATGKLGKDLATAYEGFAAPYVRADETPISKIREQLNEYQEAPT